MIKKLLGGNRLKYIKRFSELDIHDVAKVGGKNASLGEMYNSLVKKGVNIPNGFALTSQAYRHFLKENSLDQKIEEILKSLNTSDLSSLQSVGERIRAEIEAGRMPDDLRVEVITAYKHLSKQYNQDYTDVAVRSSATAEDLPGASFAGQQATFLNIKGADELIKAVIKCFASLFTDRAISYRSEKGFEHMKTYLSVGVQKMVRSDKAYSGIMFTLDPDTGFSDAIVINSSWGLGELIVQGEVIPDEFVIHEATLRKGFPSIIDRKIGSKEKQLIYAESGETQLLETADEKRLIYTLTDKEVLQLAKWATIIEDHYGKEMDTEWAKDGISGELFIVQARPETIFGSKNLKIEDYELKESGTIVTSGAAVGTKISSGKVRVLNSAEEINQFQPGEVLVTRITDPDWEPIMKIASAIVTNEGGRTSHAAIVSRELGIPAIVGTKNATEATHNEQIVTIDCSSGSVGNVYDGGLKFEIHEYKVDHLKRPKTKIMMNIGSPDEAFKNAQIPNDGVGLAREEFIIASKIKIHPLALINFDSLEDQDLKYKIEQETKGYSDKKEFYVEKLASGIGRIAAAFYPHDVIVRFSDFKTNEYSSLLGGGLYEPHEENPMIGWRGASRYYDPKFEPAFGLECAAIKKVREVWGLTNLVVMVPFCRTPEEGRKVLETMKKYGLERGKNGLRVYMMAEIPSNVILADKFLALFDGFSIGSNDLTQLTYGLDRESFNLSHIANENDDALKELVRELIEIANRKGKYIGICGQAPSDYPEFAKFLVKEGIKSISLNPDTIIKTTILIAKEEG